MDDSSSSGATTTAMIRVKWHKKNEDKNHLENIALPPIINPTNWLP